MSNCAECGKPISGEEIMCEKCWAAKKAWNEEDLALAKHFGPDTVLQMFRMAMAAANEFENAIHKIEDPPAANTPPAACGHWDIKTRKLDGLYTGAQCGVAVCSVCGEFNVCQSNYCPNCGAEMDGVRKSKEIFSPNGEDPVPLTKEEIKEMVGEWVWIVVTFEHVYPFEGYARVSPSCVDYFELTLPIDSYGDGWVAYRDRPKRGA